MPFYFVDVFISTAECVSACLFSSPSDTSPSPLTINTHLMYYRNVVGFADAHADAVRLERCLRVVRDGSERGRTDKRSREAAWVVDSKPFSTFVRVPG